MTISRGRPGSTVRLTTTELTGDGERSREDRVVAEEPLEIRLGWPRSPARRAWVTMRTPGHDFDLAAGWLVHEGVAAPDAVASVAYCTDHDLTPQQELNVVTVTLDRPPAEDPLERLHSHGTGSSACGVCGKDSLEAVMTTPRAPRWSGPLPSPDVVRSLPDRLRAAQAVFDVTGGLHAAALADEHGELLVVREDVGRHNAVDKVTGARVLGGRPTAVPMLVVSGRAGFELVQKAVAAGAGAMAAVGAPTALAVALAREAGLVLYGFTHAERTVRYA